MINYEIQTKSTEQDFYDTDKDSDYCTNPLSESNEIKKISWLDDYGWI